MKNFVLKLFLNSLSVFVLATYVLGGVHVSSFGYAIIVALTLSLLNVSVKPLLIIFTLPATIFSLGLFLFVINTIIIKIAAYLLPGGFSVDGWGWAFAFSVLLSVFNGILESLIKVPAVVSSREKDVKIYDKDGNRIA